MWRAAKPRCTFRTPDVRDAIGAGFQRVAGILQSGDVDDGRLFAEMRGGDGCGKGFAIERGAVERVPAERRSARSRPLPALCSARMAAAIVWRVNMSR